MTTTRITIDTVTRIEGHLKIDCEITDGYVTNAWCSATLFRGIEKILTGRKPDEAWLFTQRLCGVCTYVHGVASVRSVENALNIAVPANARIVRNLLMGGQYVHDHPLHFYQLHGLDWVDLVSAMNADASATQTLAGSISPDAPDMDFAGTKTKLQTFINSGQLGPFDSGYWGHPAMKLTPEENLLIATHYFYNLHEQIKAANMHAIFGAKNPHLQTLRVGGVTCSRDITAARIAQFRTYLTDLRNFINTVYIPDVKYIAKKYAASAAGAWTKIGGFANYMSYGEFQLDDVLNTTNLFIPRGIILNRNLAGVQAVDLTLIKEDVEHAWYTLTAPLHPYDGQTNPEYTSYDTSHEYSWLKAPRYNGQPVEVGPLARIMVAYAKNHNVIVPLVNTFLSDTGLAIADMHSTLGRIAARAIETKAIADAMDGWLDQLVTGGTVKASVTMPGTAQGYGLNEAPRGALGHWIKIASRVIGNYQMVVPSTWNFGPRCTNELMSPVEQALIGTPVADSSKPVEILRTVHSFDPCIACAVHAFDVNGGKTYEIRVL